MSDKKSTRIAVKLYREYTVYKSILIDLDSVLGMKYGISNNRLYILIKDLNVSKNHYERSSADVFKTTYRNADCLDGIGTYE